MGAPIPYGQQNLELLIKLAVEAALSSDWNEAIKLNQKILTLEQDNIEALNRLAKAFMCAGKIDKAQKIYKMVLDLDQYNIIAKKNIEKISKLTKSTTGDTKKTNGHINLSTVFLIEPGKTKTINLLNLASPAVLAALNCGDELEIIPKKHSITISTQEDIYVGALPDDVSFKMLAFIEGGNKYEAFVKSATTKTLTVFIREVERATKFANQPSFQESPSFEDKDNFFA
ncbi:MAG: hypothetical protein UU23_C0001G0011 [Candidatus Curtissbacteria bacterium GW2011_GWA1_40_9]|uniref:Uncharacterized protein n=1 Tax=Candidatus Curtissbacteria bacterium GW2011_GWA1_40_9 TaxID=1618408 RepID=A0A0G0WS81_9BACT|nr:MAG: hypothetical protein UU23_C0001G0011 [Candidatus Curtissbacteria bacterium GW2011_GWA1_40_9]